MAACMEERYQLSIILILEQRKLGIQTEWQLAAKLRLVALLTTRMANGNKKQLPRIFPVILWWEGCQITRLASAKEDQITSMAF